MPRTPSVHLTCKLCTAPFTVPACRGDTAKFCSRKCSDSAPRERQSTLCRECGKEFHLKKSQAARNTAHGNFCGKVCFSAFRSRIYIGEGNPNDKGRNVDYDGYRIFSPPASLGLGLGRIKMHIAVTLGVLGIKKIPLGLHVHHRDCDVLNNDASNLQVLTASDHKWIHKQYGVATLRAIERGKVDIDDAAQWSDDPIRAKTLLLNNLPNQAVFFKYCVEKFGSADLAMVVAAKPTRVTFVEVDELSDTARGTGGFGSTGS